MMLKVATLFVILLVTPKEATGETEDPVVPFEFPVNEDNQKAIEININNNNNYNNNNNVPTNFDELMAARQRAINELAKTPDLPWAEQGKLSKDMDDANNALVIFTLQAQVKDLVGEVKSLRSDLCQIKRAVKACCNKTLTCPSGYEWFCEKPGMCYKFATDEKNYTDASSTCHQVAGGHLAMPKDKVTNDLLSNQVKARYQDAVWFGLMKGSGDHEWVWDDMTHLGNWSNWPERAGETDPEISPGSKCVSWDPPPKWSAVATCTSRQPYVCEVKAAVSPTTVGPATVGPATVAPATVAPATVSPTTVSPTTVSP
ncbi:uncharacterized protein [Branchiostoma lanceolatum]|uniref:uncharacterized protein n=1 Tax=Branchiostoma lanceolatum TaxID=7740 RepID=UPI0034524113